MTKSEILAAFRQRPVAHRGLHDNASSAPENSMAAFRLAVQGGYPIELDLHLSADRQVVVIHDGTLDRVSGVSGNVSALDYAQLSGVRLFGTDEHIPLFSEVLQLVSGKVPLLIELKADSGETDALCVAVDALLSDYSGIYCIESFSPQILRWYKRNRPDVVRGQLACDMGKGLRRRALTDMWRNVFTKPDFIAYDHFSADRKCLHFWKKRLGCALACWTLHNQQDFEKAKRTFDIFIFDGFIPQ